MPAPMAFKGHCRHCDRQVFAWIKATHSSGYYVRCAECGTPTPMRQSHTLPGGEA